MQQVYNNSSTKQQETFNIKKKVKMETYNYLLVWGDKLKSLLNNSAAVHLQSQGQNVPTDTFCQGQLLIKAAKLERRTDTVVLTCTKPL